jgi:uncharacterized protein YbcC (UPF0753/DUF2309 family)
MAKGLEGKRRGRLYATQAWKAFKSTALSSFAFVDAMGLFFAVDLFGESFGRKARRAAEHEHAGLEPAEEKTRTPRLTSTIDDKPIPLEDRLRLAEGLLRAMSLTRGFARLVVLVGHGAATRNNPYAAGLDCGACCGQTGEVNARAAAALLNDEEVRRGLAGRGIDVPATTKFIGALHNTTTDDVSLFDQNAIAKTHAGDLSALREKLDRASIAARRERAQKLGLEELSDRDLHAAVIEKSVNWAEVRPEWGLTGNATFIVAPRERSAHLELAGRAFLHDYRVDEDKDFAILEAIMTGPMVVTHWINFQYLAMWTGGFTTGPAAPPGKATDGVAEATGPASLGAIACAVNDSLLTRTNASRWGILEMTNGAAALAHASAPKQSDRRTAFLRAPVARSGAFRTSYTSCSRPTSSVSSAARAVRAAHRTRRNAAQSTIATTANANEARIAIAKQT